METSDPDEAVYFQLFKDYQELHDDDVDTDAINDMFDSAILQAIKQITEKKSATVDPCVNDVRRLIVLRSHTHQNAFDTDESNDLYGTALNNVIQRFLEAKIAGNDSANEADINHLAELKQTAGPKVLNKDNEKLFERALENTVQRIIDSLMRDKSQKSPALDIAAFMGRVKAILGVSNTPKGYRGLPEPLVGLFKRAIEDAARQQIAQVLGASAKKPATSGHKNHEASAISHETAEVDTAAKVVTTGKPDGTQGSASSLRFEDMDSLKQSVSSGENSAATTVVIAVQDRDWYWLGSRDGTKPPSETQRDKAVAGAMKADKHLLLDQLITLSTQVHNLQHVIFEHIEVLTPQLLSGFLKLCSRLQTVTLQECRHFNTQTITKIRVSTKAPTIFCSINLPYFALANKPLINWIGAWLCVFSRWRTFVTGEINKADIEPEYTIGDGEGFTPLLSHQLDNNPQFIPYIVSKLRRYVVTDTTTDRMCHLIARVINAPETSDAGKAAFRELCIVLRKDLQKLAPPDISKKAWIDCTYCGRKLYKWCYNKAQRKEKKEDDGQCEECKMRLNSVPLYDFDAFSFETDLDTMGQFMGTMNAKELAGFMSICPDNLINKKCEASKPWCCKLTKWKAETNPENFQTKPWLQRSCNAYLNNDERHDQSTCPDAHNHRDLRLHLATEAYRERHNRIHVGGGYSTGPIALKVLCGGEKGDG